MKKIPFFKNLRCAVNQNSTKHEEPKMQNNSIAKDTIKQNKEVKLYSQLIDIDKAFAN